VEKRAPTLGIAGALQGRVKSEIRFVERETSADSKTKHLNHELRPPYCGVLPACKELLLPTALNAADEPLAIVINLNEGADLEHLSPGPSSHRAVWTHSLVHNMNGETFVQ